MTAAHHDHADLSPLDILLRVQAEELDATCWQDALATLAASIAAQAGLPSAQALVASAMERELCEPTHLGKGMALPHARVAGLPCAAVLVAHSVEGIAWHTDKAHLIVFLAVPEEMPGLYLHVLSHLIRWRLGLDDSLLTQRLLPVAAWEEELGALLRR